MKAPIYSAPTDFALMSGRDRVCEIRVMIAEAHKLLRKEIPSLIKDEDSFFYGPWLVWRNLMNDHPAACLEEYRHMATIFDADSKEMVTEIANLIEQHIELTRQSINLNGMHQHQADAMVGIANGTTSAEVTMRIGAGKTRNPYRTLADAVCSYIRSTSEKEPVFAFCVILTKKLKSDCYDRYSDMTQSEMIECVRGLILESGQSIKDISVHVNTAQTELSMPDTTPFISDCFDFNAGDKDNYADNENYAFR